MELLTPWDVFVWPRGGPDESLFLDGCALMTPLCRSDVAANVCRDLVMLGRDFVRVVEPANASMSPEEDTRSFDPRLAQGPSSQPTVTKHLIVVQGVHQRQTTRSGRSMDQSLLSTSVSFFASFSRVNEV